MFKNQQIEISTPAPHSSERKQEGELVTKITSRFKTKLEISFCRSGPKLATSSEWYTSKISLISLNDNDTPLAERLAQFVLIGVGAELVRQASELMSLLWK